MQVWDLTCVRLHAVHTPTQELLAAIAKQARGMKPGARFVTLKTFGGGEDKYFDTLEKRWFKMSWGRTTVHFLQRRKRVRGDRSSWLA